MKKTIFYLTMVAALCFASCSGSSSESSADQASSGQDTLIESVPALDTTTISDTNTITADPVTNS